jgi:hypothetical protein
MLSALLRFRRSRDQMTYDAAQKQTKAVKPKITCTVLSDTNKAARASGTERGPLMATNQDENRDPMKFLIEGGRAMILLPW